MDGFRRGPRMPPVAQTLAWALAPTWLMDRCAERLGEAFTMTFAPSGMQLVMVSDPAGGQGGVHGAAGGGAVGGGQLAGGAGDGTRARWWF